MTADIQTAASLIEMTENVIFVQQVVDSRTDNAAARLRDAACDTSRKIWKVQVSSLSNQCG